MELATVETTLGMYLGNESPEIGTEVGRGSPVLLDFSRDSRTKKGERPSSSKRAEAGSPVESKESSLLDKENCLTSSGFVDLALELDELGKAGTTGSPSNGPKVAKKTESPPESAPSPGAGSPLLLLDSNGKEACPSSSKPAKQDELALVVIPGKVQSPASSSVASKKSPGLGSRLGKVTGILKLKSSFEDVSVESDGSIKSSSVLQDSALAIVNEKEVCDEVMSFKAKATLVRFDNATYGWRSSEPGTLKLLVDKSTGKGRLVQRSGNLELNLAVDGMICLELVSVAVKRAVLKPKKKKFLQFLAVANEDFGVECFRLTKVKGTGRVDELCAKLEELGAEVKRDVGTEVQADRI